MKGNLFEKMAEKETDTDHDKHFVQIELDNVNVNPIKENGNQF